MKRSHNFSHAVMAVVALSVSGAISMSAAANLTGESGGERMPFPYMRPPMEGRPGEMRTGSDSLTARPGMNQMRPPMLMNGMRPPMGQSFTNDVPRGQEQRTGSDAQLRMGGQRPMMGNMQEGQERKMPMNMPGGMQQGGGQQGNSMLDRLLNLPGFDAEDLTAEQIAKLKLNKTKLEKMLTKITATEARNQKRLDTQYARVQKKCLKATTDEQKTFCETAEERYNDAVEQIKAASEDRAQEIQDMIDEIDSYLE